MPTRGLFTANIRSRRRIRSASTCQNSAKTSLKRGRTTASRQRRRACLGDAFGDAQFSYGRAASPARSSNASREFRYLFTHAGATRRIRRCIATTSPTCSAPGRLMRATGVSDAMMAAWVNFAATGDPNGAGAPHWAPTMRTRQLPHLRRGFRGGHALGARPLGFMSGSTRGAASSRRVRPAQRGDTDSPKRRNELNASFDRHRVIDGARKIRSPCGPVARATALDRLGAADERQASSIQKSTNASSRARFARFSSIAGFFRPAAATRRGRRRLSEDALGRTARLRRGLARRFPQRGRDARKAFGASRRNDRRVHPCASTRTSASPRFRVRFCATLKFMSAA